MNTIIIEDETLAAQRLNDLINTYDPGIQVKAHLDSIEASIEWLQNNPQPNLIFMDIQLGDGLSFSIFSQITISSPVIFTTAFDQYTLRAFKVNSIDYLLKPIKQSELNQALDKYKSLHPVVTPNQRIFEDMLKIIQGNHFKQRFLIKQGKDLLYIPVEDILVFYSEDGHSFLKTRNQSRYLLDYTLDQIEEMIDPTGFFRINRKCIIHLDSIRKIQPYFSGRLSLELDPACPQNMTVSRDRVADFKEWLDH